MIVDQIDSQLATAEASAVVSDDDALGAVWDELSTEDNASGPERGEDGRFKGAAADKPAAQTEDGEPAADEAAEGAEPAAATTSVPLPPNWNGLDEDWKKIPPDVQAKIATRDAELHARMSEQGRQIGAVKPMLEVADRNRDLFEAHKMPDGSAVTPTAAFDFLLSAQRQLDADPVRALIDIADRYGARQMLAAVLTGQAPLPPAPQPKQPAGMTPADVQRAVQEALAETNQVKTANEEIGRLSQDKPLFSEIAEEDMVHSIHKARQRLGDAASNEAVFTLAYDMAVNADPDLRAKAAAAANVAKKAAAPDPKRTVDAKRAASINVTSTSSGKGRALTEDEQLAQAYDAAQKDR